MIPVDYEESQVWEINGTFVSPFKRGTVRTPTSKMLNTLLVKRRASTLYEASEFMMQVWLVFHAIVKWGPLNSYKASRLVSVRRF
jgi:hypothetical protein